MSKEVINEFQKLGFIVDHVHENVYGLTYELIKLVYRVYPEDKHFIDVGMPFDISHISRTSAYELANELNVRLKFIKSYVYNDNLWVSCERDISRVQNISAVVKDIVHCMVNAFHLYVEMKQSESHGFKAN